LEQKVDNTAGEIAKEVKPVRTRAEGVSDSWKDPAVAEARKQRHAVSVGGVMYKSVTEAFKALDLPLNRHIAFRAQLKAEGNKVFTHNDVNYEFKLEEPIKVEPKPKAPKKAKKEKAEAPAEEQALNGAAGAIV
jgi:hypothetical protein